MTIEWAIVLGLAGCGIGANAPLDPGPNAGPMMRESCTLATRRCSRCHPIDRVLATSVRGRVAWESYVDRMRLMPGSGISNADAPLITDCLVRWSDARTR